MAERSRRIQKTKPHWCQDTPEFAFSLYQPMTVISMQPIPSQNIGGVLERAESLVPLEQPIVLLRFLAFPHALFPLRVIAVIMILVNRKNYLRGIYHGCAGSSRKP